MSKILKNTTIANIEISDTGITIPASSSYTIPPSDYLLWADSSDVIVKMGTGDIVVNDGSRDLSISDGTSLIKGSYPSSMYIENTIPINFVDSKMAYDSFGRLRTSDINNIFESTHVNSEQIEFWDYATSGGGTKTFEKNKARVVLSVGTANGDHAVRQTMNSFHYSAGQSMIIRLTGVLGSGKANLMSCLGYHNDDNGLFFRVKDGVFQVVIRSDVTGSVVDRFVNQSAFNGDKLDGTGASGITINLDKTQIFEVNYQWLGVGSISFYVHIGGKQIRLHTFHNANEQDIVYMRTPHLPVRYEIKNTGVTASASTMNQICTQIANEGNAIVGDLMNVVSTGTTYYPITALEFKPIISLRVKNLEDAILKISAVNVMVRTQDDVMVNVTVDGVLTGANWVDDSQFVQKDVSASAITGGRVVMSYYMSKLGRSSINQFSSKFRLGEYINGTKQHLTVSVKSVVSNANVHGSISFKELF